MAINTIRILTRLRFRQFFRQKNKGLVGKIIIVVYFCLMEMLLFFFAQRITREKISYKDFLAVLPQRIIYGVICTFLLYKAALYAFIGVTVLWNKVDRKGNNRPLPDQTGSAG